jgi:uncharacterized protein (TIGR04255 family)
MAKRRCYENPPLVEALCQFQFAPGSEWDMAIPGLLYRRVREQFPERRQQKAIQWVVSPAAGEVETTSTSDRMQFRSQDGKSLIQVGPDLLVVNALKPYPGWDAFRSMVLSTLTYYREEARPAGIKSLTLRYINRLIFPPTPVQIEDFMHFYPNVPTALPQTFVGWAQSVNVPLSQEEILRLTAGSSDEHPEENVFVLDLEFVAFRGCSLEDVGLRIDKGHEIIEDAFEECITDKARWMFKEEKSHEHAPSL